MVQPSANDLNKISQLIEAGQVEVYITDTLRPEEAQTALEIGQQRDAGRHKVVLSIKWPRSTTQFRSGKIVQAR